jgi:hypothetical protein
MHWEKTQNNGKSPVAGSPVGSSRCFVSMGPAAAGREERQAEKQSDPGV